jgi:hypothetical protein
MANETPPSSGAAGRAKAVADSLTTSLREAQGLADVFAQKAATATGVASKQMDNMASLYKAMAKNIGEIQDTSKEINDIEAKRLKTLKEIEDLQKKGDKADVGRLAEKEKELKNLKEQSLEKEKNLRVNQRQVDSQKAYVKEITNSDGVVSKLFKSQAAQALAWIVSTDRLIQGVKGIGRAYRDVVDISISSGSFAGMTGNLTKDTWTLTKAAASYGTNLADVAFQMGRLGISTEEGTAAYKEYAKVTGAGSGFKDQAEGMKDLTVASGYLAKELNVSLGDATAYITESTLKFGRTTGQTASTLQNLKNQEEKVNTEMGRTVIQGRDVAKVLFDIARESNSGAQEQDVLSKMIVKNMVALQGQGNSYEQSLKSATGYVKGLTTEAPDWARIMAGRDLFKEIKAGSGKNGIGDALRAQLEAAKPGLTKQVQDIMSSTNTTDYDKQRQVQELLQDTSVGMDVMEKRMSDYITSTGKNATQAVMAIYGITDPLEAKRRADQFMMNKASRVEAENFLKLTDEAAAKKYDISVDEVKYYKQAENHADLRAMMDAKATTEIEKQAKIEQAIQDAAKAAHKKELEDELAIAKAKGDTHLAGTLQKRLDSESDSDKRVKQIAEEEKKKYAGAALVTGGDVQGGWQAMIGSAAGNIALGGISLTLIGGLTYYRKKLLGSVKAGISKIIKGAGSGGGEGIVEGLGKSGEKAVISQVLESGGKTALKTGLKGLGRNLPYIGPLLGAGYDIYQGHGVARSLIRAASGEVGAVGGGLAAGAAGSVVPVAGTAAGLFVGGTAGGVAGYAGGGALADRLGFPDQAADVYGKNDAIAGTAVANIPGATTPGTPTSAVVGGPNGSSTPGSVPNLLQLTGTPTGQSYLMNATFDLGQAVAYIQGLQGRFGAGAPTGR